MPPHHWLLRPTCTQSEGSSVSGSGYREPPAPRVLDPFYIRSHFDDAPDDALESARAAIVDIQRERRTK
jgi:hypothetical protein